MNRAKIITSILAAAVLICTTGCFRVSSETRALRDAALEFGAVGAKEKIELGVGFFTIGLAKLGTRFVDLPPEVKMVLGSVDGAECSVYELRGRKPNLAEVLLQADRAMSKRGCDRVVGVVDKDQLVAVYMPRNVSSHRKMSISVLVLNDEQLVCATARGNLDSIIQMNLLKSANVSILSAVQHDVAP